MNQAILSMELNERVAPIVRQINGEECRDLISRVVCHYFFAPCGENGLLHLPLSVCPEECLFVKSYCSPHLDTINDLLDPIGLGNVVCDASYHLQGLSPCCSGAGIEIKSTLISFHPSLRDSDTSPSLLPSLPIYLSPRSSPSLLLPVSLSPPSHSLNRHNSHDRCGPNS